MAISEKLDLHKLHKAEYVTPRTPVIVKIEPAKYLAITGQGEPGGSVFQAKLSALYSVAYTIKMAQKSAGRDYTVCKLEGLWWGKTPGDDFFHEARQSWNWTLVIRVPDFILNPDLLEAVKSLRAKAKPLEVTEVSLKSLEEGRCVQMLHIGPYEEESVSIAQMNEFATANGLSYHGLHHEIYLSDPRREPASLRTILRHPVR